MDNGSGVTVETKFCVKEEILPPADVPISFQIHRVVDGVKAAEAAVCPAVAEIFANWVPVHAPVARFTPPVQTLSWIVDSGEPPLNRSTMLSGKAVVEVTSNSRCMSCGGVPVRFGLSVIPHDEPGMNCVEVRSTTGPGSFPAFT
jgi:hypothetical protein